MIHGQDARATRGGIWLWMGGEEMDLRFKISDLRLVKEGGRFSIYHLRFSIGGIVRSLRRAQGRLFDGSTKLTAGETGRRAG